VKQAQQKEKPVKMEQDFALNIFADLGDNGCDSGNSGGSREPSIYVFGYGSLVWNPGFEFSKCITGCEFAFYLLTTSV
jgi:ChaC-like protein